MRESRHRVAVVGGGVSGLSAAHRLGEIAAGRQVACDVTVFEATGRAGGVIASRRQDGFLLESGPDSLITEKPWAVRLAERIGLADRLVCTQERHRRSFVVHRGRLHPTPEGFELLAPTRFLPLVTTPLFSPLGKLRMGCDLILPRGEPTADESIGHFVRRRLGRQALDRIAQPMITAIYGADPSRLSLRATFPRFLQMEAESRSLIKAMWSRSRRRRRAVGAESAASGARY
ncbi:MAG: protoporphyrinogen oxidase, partial [Acidobacteriota bacterium]